MSIWFRGALSAWLIALACACSKGEADQDGYSPIDSPPVAISRFDLPQGIVLEMISLPGKTFVQGSSDAELHRDADEGPQHTVTLSAFLIGRFEVTQAQWQAVMGSNPSLFLDNPNRPVEQVGWNDLTTDGTGFLARLNAATAGQRPPGWSFRLPTEAEWEFASRAGTQTRFPWGDDPSYAQLESYAWYESNAMSTTHPVGKKQPNAYGLYDMTGNVAEWCQDGFGAYASGPQTDPKGAIGSASRVIRGGSWRDSDRSCRSANRASGLLARDSQVGLRVVLAPPALPTAYTIILPGGGGLDLVPLPGGTFLMGSPETELERGREEGPRHPVTVSAFHIGKFEVTQAQWLAVMGHNPSFSRGDLNRPVESVSWDDISGATTGFLARLNAATASQRPAGFHFRLPTEAEWEYAARGGTQTRFYWGEDPTKAQMNLYAWHGDNSGMMPHPVGQKLPNPFGLCDMSGNVFEWCSDWQGPYSEGAQTDPTGPTIPLNPIEGSCKITRGGDWWLSPDVCRSANRGWDWPYSHSAYVGLRVVLGFQGMR